MTGSCISGMYLQTQIFLRLKKKWYGTTLRVIIKKRTNFSLFLFFKVYLKSIQKIPKKVLTQYQKRYNIYIVKEVKNE